MTARDISLPKITFQSFNLDDEPGSLFGPDATAQVIKNGAAAEAERREVDTMQAVAQTRRAAKENSFGIADPHSVVDLDKVAIDPKIAAEREREAEGGAGYRYHGRVEMTARQWAAVPANPRQRDTEAHAKKAKHLRTYDPVHRFVNMARLPDGRMFKLDGHTRSYLWQRGEVAGPATLFVEVYLCDDEAAAKRLYSKFDSQAAVETGADKIVGAAREQGLTFTSPMLRAGRYGSAVKRLYMYTTKSWGDWSSAQFVYDAVGFYRDELKRLDAINPQPAAFTSGVTMAALATFKRRGAEATKFWTNYAANIGSKDGLRMDGVEALRQAVADTKLMQARRTDGGGAQQLVLLGKGILAYEAFRLGRTYTAGKGGGIRTMDDDVLKEYLRRSVEG